MSIKTKRKNLFNFATNGWVLEQSPFLTKEEPANKQKIVLVPQHWLTGINTVFTIKFDLFGQTKEPFVPKVQIPTSLPITFFQNNIRILGTAFSFIATFSPCFFLYRNSNPDADKIRQIMITRLKYSTVSAL
jgi:hypothetical protein